MYALESLSYKHKVYTSWFIRLFIYILHMYICVCVQVPSQTFHNPKISFHRITFMLVIPPFRLTFVCFDKATLGGP